MRRRLEHGESEGEVYYDVTCPLGNFLLNFEGDIKGEWNTNGMLLRESYGKGKILPVMGSARWNMVAPVSDFLREKYKSGEPSAVFAAIRTWDEYLNLHNKRKSSDTLTDRLHMLYKPFVVYADVKPWVEEAAAALSDALRGGDSQIELWYPVAKRPLETVVVTSSLLPVIFHYKHKIKEWGYAFRQCKVCNKGFLALSRKYGLCSDKCRKKQAITAKKGFNERTKDDKPTNFYDAAYQHWYNHKRKLKSGKNANPDGLAVYEVEMQKFCKAAMKRKKALKQAEQTAEEYANYKNIEEAEKLRKEFQSWLSQQRDVADKLMDELTM